MIIENGVADPNGGTGAVRVTNSSAVPQPIAQTLAAPAGFQYCFSAYFQSATSAPVLLTRSSANAQQSFSCSAGPNWSRATSSGTLRDSGTGLTVGVSLAPAQTITIFGPQLEPQFEPSRFRPTFSRAGLYPIAHWSVAELIFTADGPNSFSTSFSIESSTGN